MDTAAPVRAALRPQAGRRQRRAVRTTLHRRTRLDGLFDRLLLAFRRSLVESLDREPPGPARHLRAYLRCVCAHALAQRKGRYTAAWLLSDAQNRAIWRDFVDQACAGDLLDQALSRQCRAAVGQLWFAQVLRPGAAGEIALARDRLLALC